MHYGGAPVRAHSRLHRCAAASAAQRQTLTFHFSAPGHPAPGFAQAQHKCSIEHILSKNPPEYPQSCAAA